MNLGKNKFCVVGGDHLAQCSMVMIVSTVGEKPRKQVSTKAVKVCFAHASVLQQLLGGERSDVPLETIESLCGDVNASKQHLRSREHVEKAVCGLPDRSLAARALNHRRWNVLKVGHKRKAGK